MRPLLIEVGIHPGSAVYDSLRRRLLHKPCPGPFTCNTPAAMQAFVVSTCQILLDTIAGARQIVFDGTDIRYYDADQDAMLPMGNVELTIMTTMDGVREWVQWRLHDDGTQPMPAAFVLQVHRTINMVLSTHCGPGRGVPFLLRLLLDDGGAGAVVYSPRFFLLSKEPVPDHAVAAPLVLDEHALAKPLPRRSRKARAVSPQDVGKMRMRAEGSRRRGVVKAEQFMASRGLGDAAADAAASSPVGDAAVAAGDTAADAAAAVAVADDASPAAHHVLDAALMFDAAGGSSSDLFGLNGTGSGFYAHAGDAAGAAGDAAGDAAGSGDDDAWIVAELPVLS